MGYTIAAHARDAHSRDLMYEFMEKNYRKSPLVFYGKDELCYSRLACGKDLSYDHNKLAIGFDYNACEPERDYIFAVVRWMALKIGKLVMVKNLGETPMSYYDGGSTSDDRWPVLDKTLWKSKVPIKWDRCLTNSVGHRSQLNQYEGVPLYDEKDAIGKKEFIRERSNIMREMCGLSMEDIDAIIGKELKRLDRLWKKHTHIKKEAGNG
jgi:hypothetical protein